MIINSCGARGPLLFGKLSIAFNVEKGLLSLNLVLELGVKFQEATPFKGTSHFLKRDLMLVEGGAFKKILSTLVDRV